METNTLKWICLVALFALALIGGLAPLKMRHFDPSGRYLALGNMFSAGIFLGGGLLHLLPEAAEGLEEVTSSMSGILHSFPSAFFLAGLGFITILCVEELVLACSSNNSNDDNNDDNHNNSEQLSSVVADSTDTSSPRYASAPARSNTSPIATTNATNTAAVTSITSINSGNNGGASPRALDDTNVSLNSPRHTHTHARVHSHAHTSNNNKANGKLILAGSLTSFTARSSPSSSSVVAGAAAAVRSVNADEQFLKLYYSRRNVARGIVASLGPRSTLHLHDISLPDQPLGFPSVNAGLPTASYAHTSYIRPINNDNIRHIHTHTHGNGNGQRNGSAHHHHHNDTKQPLLAAATSITNDDNSHHDEHQSNSRASQSHGHTGGGDAGAGGHGHGHGGDDHDHFNFASHNSPLVAYILVLALSFHSIFEGIALGTQDEFGTTLSIFIAIAAHTPLAGFALGISLVKAAARLRMIIICIVIFGMTVPIGAVMGLAMSYALQGDTLTAVSSSFQAFSAGTFLFVAFEEIIPKEMASPRDKWWKLLLLVIGFVGMAAVKATEADDDHHHDN